MLKRYTKIFRAWENFAMIALILLLCSSFSQFQNEKDWNPDSPLTWDDYQRSEKGTKDSRSNSHTLCGERWIYKRVDSNQYKFVFKVKSVMVKNLSWVDPNYKTQELLEHEQLHFDLSEYFARQLLLALQKAQYTANYKTEMQEIRHNMTVQRNNLQELYDNQTKHSRNRILQAKWNLYVKHLLESNEVLEIALTKVPNIKN